MKTLFSAIVLVLTVAVCPLVQAQTMDGLNAAYTRQDYGTAFAGFKKLADQGNMYAQYNLATMYRYGRHVSKDIKQALKWLEMSADQGFSEAQFVLGSLYSEGDGVLKDEKRAAAWYLKAAEQGHASAQYNLGVMYDSGQGVSKDLEKATAWQRKSAEQGVSQAQFRMGSRYEYGDGVEKNVKQAFDWYTKAANQGHLEAQKLLGLRYSFGFDIPKDVIKSVEWYRKAAEQGDADAQNSLGASYSNGVGIAKDDVLAASWFRASAEQGNTNAQRNLGLKYYFGRGVPKDAQLAYFWWLLSSASTNASEADSRKAFASLLGGKDNYTETDTLRDVVEREISSEQRAAAQQSTRNWKPKTAAQALRAMEDSTNAGALDPKLSQKSPDVKQADSTGSGFRVAPGAVVTNHHVIDGCSRLSVNGAAAKVRGSDARSDLALINVTTPGAIVGLRAQRAAVGETVSVAGYPLRGLLSGFNMTTGNLSSLSGIGGDTRLLQISAPVQPGNSGGPALDSAGNLLGVVVSKLDAVKTAKVTGDIPQNVNFAINPNVLRAFLDANGVDYETASSAKPLAATAIAEKAKGFTVLVECWK